MSCRHLAAAAAGLDAAGPGPLAGDSAFTVDASRVTFGAGALAEVGDRARAHGMKRVALITDARLRQLPWFDEVQRALAGLDVAVFDGVSIEPTDASFDDAVRFARDARVDGYVSLGGGSVIDTAKAANLYATYPAALRAYVNAPVGDAQPVPGPLAPHIACPTTSGTGSEVTGIAIFDWVALHAKTGIASPRLRPSEALVDPRVTQTLPANVVAASGMDVLCHALESYTARPFTLRPKTPVRPMSQGQNPWSDLGCREAIQLCAMHLADAVAGNSIARNQMMWAATLAGIAFGNAGVHVPHAMAYAIAGRVRSFAPDGYPQPPIVPHGMAVALGAPAVFDRFGEFCDDRHREAGVLMGADAREAGDQPGGAVLAARVRSLMREIGVPVRLGDVGYTAADISDLVAGTLPQQRLLVNAPCAVDADCLTELFRHALT